MSDVQNEKLNALRDIILDRADGQRSVLLREAKQEADAWTAQEPEKLDRETDLVLQDARNRSEDIRRRQILTAERERSTETLRLQNRLLGEALGMLQAELVRLRDRDDYPQILAGLVLEGVAAAGQEGTYRVRLAAADAALGDQVVGMAKTERPGLELTYAPNPAPVLGGVWLASEDGRRQVNADWHQRAREMADELAERLMPLL